MYQEIELRNDPSAEFKAFREEKVGLGCLELTKFGQEEVNSSRSTEDSNSHDNDFCQLADQDFILFEDSEVEKCAGISKKITKKSTKKQRISVAKSTVPSSLELKKRQQRRMKKLSKLSFYPHIMFKTPKTTKKSTPFESRSKPSRGAAKDVESRFLPQDSNLMGALRIKRVGEELKAKIAKRRAKPVKKFYDRAMVANSVFSSQNLMSVELLASTLVKSKAANSVGGELCSKLDSRLFGMMDKVKEKEERHRQKARYFEEAEEDLQSLSSSFLCF